MEKKIKVFLVDDSEVVRMGLQSLLSMYDTIDVVGEAGCADDAIKSVKEKKPDIVLMDIRMPCKSGIEACSEIKKVAPTTAVIMLTSYDDDKVIYNSIIAGASGYVLKEISSKELVKAIEKVAEGKSLLDPSITTKVLNRIRSIEEKSKIDDLTRQEKLVLYYVSQGKTNKEIASIIALSEKTIRNYISQILSKLEVSNRVEATAYAVRFNINI